MSYSAPEHDSRCEQRAATPFDHPRTIIKDLPEIFGHSQRSAQTSVDQQAKGQNIAESPSKINNSRISPTHIDCSSSNPYVSVASPVPDARLRPVIGEGSHARAEVAKNPDKISDEERTQIIDNLATEAGKHYVDPKIGKMVEDKLHAWLASGKYNNTTGGAKLAADLESDLRSLTHDKHFSVRFSKEALPKPDGSAEPSPEEVKRMASTNFDIEKVELNRIGNKNIGYLDLRGFPPDKYFKGPFTEAMTKLANADALVIDLRNNGGGEPESVTRALSYLLKPNTHTNDIQWRERPTERFETSEVPAQANFGAEKPVYVLTSKKTFSGGEEFAYDLQNLRRATLIGETTGGGAHPTAPFLLSPHFEAQVPVGQAVNPITGKNWERVGVKPDVQLPANNARAEAIRRAVEELNHRAHPPR